MRMLLLGAMLTALAAPVGRADDAKDLVEKVMKAHGGKELLAKYKGGESTITGSMSVMGNDIDLKGTILTADGGKARLDMTADFMGQKLAILQISNGKNSTMKVSLAGADLPAPPTPAEELKMSGIVSEMTKIYPLLDEAKFKIKKEADADVDGKKAELLVVTVVELKKDVKLYFDKETSYMVKQVRTGLNPTGGGDAEREMLLTDHKKIDGIPLAMKMVSYIDGVKQLTIVLKEHKNLEKVDDKKFSVDD